MTYEVTQQIKRVGSFTAESDSEALTLAKHKFSKQIGYMEEVTYTVRPMLLPSPDSTWPAAAEIPQPQPKVPR